MGDPREETPDITTLTKYLPSANILSLMAENSADMFRIWDARDLALDVNKIFGTSIPNTFRVIVRKD
jgi:hypothetical protein